MSVKLLPEVIVCTECEVTVLLDEDERRTRKFVCPSCNQQADYANREHTEHSFDPKEQGEKFGINSSYKMHLRMQPVYPLIPLLGLAWTWLFTNLALTDMAPLLLFGFTIWFLFELTRALQRTQFSVELHAEWIRIGSTLISWDQIKNAEHESAVGMSPTIKLFDRSGGRHDIPAVIEAIPYIWARIQNNVDDTNEVTN